MLRRWSWLLLVPAATAVMLPLRAHLDLGTVLLVHLMTVVLVAVLGTVTAAGVAAVIAVSLVNWFFTEPYHSLRIANPATVVDLTAFMVVALTTALVVRRSRALAARAEHERTEREQVVEIDRSRATLLAALGHDLRAPISTIKATASGVLAKDVVWSADDMSDAWHLVDEEADRLADLLSNLLAQARLEAGAPIAQPVAVEVADLMRSKRLPRVPRQYRLPTDLPMVVADPGLMEQAVHNVLVNAQRHGGVNTDVLITAERDGERVLIHLDDNGRGIADDQLDTLFEPYRTAGDRSRGGTGLGLAIVRGFVEAMGGTVSAARSPRGGLRITIALRVAA